MIPIYCGVDGEEQAGLCSGTENCWAVNGDATAELIEASVAFPYKPVTAPDATAPICWLRATTL